MRTKTCLLLLTMMLACGEMPGTVPAPTAATVVPSPSRDVTPVLLAGDGGQPSSGFASDPDNGWTYITFAPPAGATGGGLYVGPVPIDGAAEGAIVVTAPRPGAPLGEAAIYKRTTLGYNLLSSPTVAHTEIVDFETPGTDDGTGSGWFNGLVSFRTHIAQSRIATPPPGPGSPQGNTNVTAACGGALTFGAQSGGDGNTCFRPQNDLEIGQDHRVLAHAGIVLDPAVMPAIEGALSQVQDPAARAVLTSIIAALKSRQLALVADHTQ